MLTLYSLLYIYFNLETNLKALKTYFLKQLLTMSTEQYPMYPVSHTNTNILFEQFLLFHMRDYCLSVVVLTFHNKHLVWSRQCSAGKSWCHVFPCTNHRLATFELKCFDSCGSNAFTGHDCPTYLCISDSDSKVIRVCKLPYSLLIPLEFSIVLAWIAKWVCVHLVSPMEGQQTYINTLIHFCSLDGKSSSLLYLHVFPASSRVSKCNCSSTGTSNQSQIPPIPSWQTPTIYYLPL